MAGSQSVLKGVGNRPFYHWVGGNFLHLFPKLPDRARLFHLFAAHQDWTNRFLADPAISGVCDTYGIELVHPMREGRGEKQMGKKGLSNHRWIVGGKLALAVFNALAQGRGWQPNANGFVVLSIAEFSL